MRGLDKIKKLSIVAMGCILASLAISTVASAQYEYEDWDSANDAAWTFLGLSGVICTIIAKRIPKAITCRCAEATGRIPIIIAILIAVWVYKDAEKRGSSGVLWVIICLFLGIIGLIIWLIVRPPIGGHPTQQPFGQQQGRMCTNCGRPIPMDAQVCPYCGKDFRH